MTCAVSKPIREINKRIQEAPAVVVTAGEIIDLVEEKGVKKAAEEIDIVTTGTFGLLLSCLKGGRRCDIILRCQYTVLLETEHGPCG